MNIDKALSGALLGSLLTSSIGYAQTKSNDAAQLEEVVVSAQRREENLQRVPIAIQVFSADDLDALKAMNSIDLEKHVPGLLFNLQPNRSSLFLRGVGSTLGGESTQPSVATYVDGVYMGTNAINNMPLAGIERMEVAKGPQGTLWGRNAVGGTINVVTKKPGKQFAGSASYGFGNYGEQDASLALSGPLGEYFRAGISMGGDKHDAYFPDVYPAGTPVSFGQPNVYNETLQGNVRGTVIWDPNSKLQMTVSADSSRNYGDGYQLARQLQDNAVGYVRYGAVPQNNPKLTAMADEFQWIENRGASLRSDVDLGWARFVQLSAYRDAPNYGAPRGGGTSAPNFVTVNGIPSGPGASYIWAVTKQLTNELQLLSPQSSAWEWIVGAFQLHSTSGFKPFRALVTSGSNYGGRRDTFDDVDTKAYALFGQTTIPVTDWFKVTVGGRYNDEKKEWSGRVATYSPSGALISNVVSIPIAPSKPQGSWKNFSPMATLNFTVGDTLLYVKYAEGFKSGAFNDGNNNQPGPLEPETLHAYSIGEKSDFFDHRLRVNTEAFLYKDKNLQYSVSSPSGIPVLQNAGKATAYGLDFDVEYAVTEKLSLSASGELARGKFDSFPQYTGFVRNPVNTGLSGGGNLQVVVDATDKEMIRLPHASGTLTADYAQPLSSGAELDFSVSAQSTSSYFETADNNPNAEVAGHTTYAASATYSNGPWKVSFWGKNLTNKYYWSVLNISTNGLVGVPGNPRTYGVTATHNFGKM